LANVACSTLWRLSHTRCRLFPGLAFKFISLELLVVVDQTNKIMTMLLGYFPAGSSHFFNGLIFKHVALLEAIFTNQAIRFPA
jgi:hypothetical protein